MSKNTTGGCARVQAAVGLVKMSSVERSAHVNDLTRASFVLILERTSCVLRPQAPARGSIRLWHCCA